MGSDLPSCLKQLKKLGKIYEIVVFKTLGIRQQRTVIPERQERNEVSPITAPANFLKGVSRWWHRERKPRKSPVDLLS